MPVSGGTDAFSQPSITGGMQTPALHVQEVADVLPAGEVDELSHFSHVHIVVLERYFPAVQLPQAGGGGGEGGEGDGGAGLGGGATTTVQRLRTAASMNKRGRLRTIHRSRRAMARTAPPCRAVLALPFISFSCVKLFGARGVCFITAGPSTKLFACRGGG